MTSAEPFDLGLLSPATAGNDSSVADGAVLAALVDAERSYLRALVAAGIAPGSAVIGDSPMLDLGVIASAAAAGGNPVIPLIAQLRAQAGADAATWIHRGATSQDILDTALVLVSQRARGMILERLDATIASLASLADAHRATVTAARTLTQHSTPTTYGLRFATWLTAVLDSRDALAAVTLPAQLGGASGTLASLVELSDVPTAARVPALFAAELDLAAAHPWHTTRAPVTRLGDALVGVTDALGLIATNVATLSRTEIGELIEPSRGGSSTMPQKQNPVLSVLIRSTALRAPGFGSTLHIAAANFADERPDGAWHAEWPTLRELLRLTLGASALAADLAAGISVDTERVAANLALTGHDILAERESLSGVTGVPGDYVGLSDPLIDDAIERARA